MPTPAMAAHLIVAATAIVALAGLAWIRRGDDGAEEWACAAVVWAACLAGVAVLVTSILWALATVLGYWGILTR